MLKKRFLVMGTILFAFLFFGCDDGEKDLPVKTVSWEVGTDGFFQYYTNDSENYDYTRWAFHNTPVTGNVFEIECKKMSGAPTLAFGMVFAGTENNLYNYYGVVTSVSRDTFYVFKSERSDEAASSTYTHLMGDTIGDYWVSSGGKIDNGYSKTNSIKAEKDTSGEWTISFNGSAVHKFTDTNSPLDGDRVGFYMSVGNDSQESFPNDPVDVRFRKK